MLSTAKLEWTVGSLISTPLSPKFCMVAPDMCDYQNVSQILDNLFSLGIHKGNVKLGPETGNFELQMGVTFE